MPPLCLRAAGIKALCKNTPYTPKSNGKYFSASFHKKTAEFCAGLSAGAKPGGGVYGAVKISEHGFEGQSQAAARSCVAENALAGSIGQVEQTGFDAAFFEVMFCKQRNVVTCGC